MPKVHIFDVKPKIPPELEDLKRLAYNLHWSWDHKCQDLFRRMDPDLWEEVLHNPVELLGRLSQEQYLELMEDDGFLDHFQQCIVDLEVYLREQSWFRKAHPDKESFKIAYFSAEFGLHACMPVYSGGLGVLAADHLKSNSDLGIPMIGMGLLYQKGYFQQYLNADGWQQEMYKVNDYSTMPVKLLLNEDGHPFQIKIDFSGRDVHMQCWKVDVGRVPLYLLDTNVPQNSPQDQSITDELYGGDLEKRIQQEIVLGIGGFRMLKELGIYPDVFHINEGHSAFLAIERVRDLITDKDLKFNEATEAASAGNIFTTHTPVPAGSDVFAVDLIKKYFGEFCSSLGMDLNGFMNLGRIKRDDAEEGFCMTVLAIKLSHWRSGVSKLHGEVSRKMWRNIWPELTLNEIPITSITNGVHAATWISREMKELLTRYLGPQWLESPRDEELWQRVDRISDEELWRTHERGRERLVAFVRSRLKAQLRNRGASEAEIRDAEDVLNPQYLTIGFARRFATYKRSTLIFHNPERLKKIITDKNRPVQFIFAGKAHPKDEPGKKLIRRIIHFARDSQVNHRIVFIENYDIMVARNMVRGVDVWLNTPRRPLEASGTSGMKVAFNGALNLSVLDGWWSEGYKPNLGWAIGRGEEYEDKELQDEVESNALHDLLEQEIIPLFYDIGSNGIPKGWVKYMKESMKSLCPEFSTNRMSFEYLEKFYLQAGEEFAQMTHDNCKSARELAGWKEKIRQKWSRVKFMEVTSEKGKDRRVEDHHNVSVKVQLGQLSPDDLSVELYYGRVNEKREIIDGITIPLDFVSLESDETAVFKGQIPLKSSGRYGFMARALPSREKMTGFEPGCITWE